MTYQEMRFILYWVSPILLAMFLVWILDLRPWQWQFWLISLPIGMIILAICHVLRVLEEMSEQ